MTGLTRYRSIGLGRIFTVYTCLMLVSSLLPSVLAPAPEGFTRMVVGFEGEIDSSLISRLGGRLVKEVPGLDAAVAMIPEKALERLMEVLKP